MDTSQEIAFRASIDDSSTLVGFASQNSDALLFDNQQNEELIRLQRQQLEEDDLFLAQQLQQAEYLQHRYFQTKSSLRSPHEKVQSTNYDHGIAYHFQGHSTGDYEDDDPEPGSHPGKEQRIPNSYTFRKPQRSTTDIEEFPVLSCSGNYRRPVKQKLGKPEPAHQVAQRDGIDYRSATLLTKMIGTGVIKDIQNILSQNKEAFLFHGGHKEHEFGCIVKVFKASKTDLKKREIYIHGEWRFRYQEHHLNPNKMLKLWAEKEFRNLKRLTKANIPCTVPIALKGHVLLLEYSGADGSQAPPLARLIASLSPSKRTELYWDTVVLVKRMYSQSALVHAGLGPFTLLVCEGRLVLSELGRAVTHDHPYATHFLRHDCYTMTQFFRSHGVDVLPTKQFYEFASQKDYLDAPLDVTHHSFQSQLDRLKQVAAGQGAPTQQEMVDELIWFELDLPTTLKDVFSPCDVPPDSVYKSAIDALGLIK